ncbi:peptidase S8 and S53, subtilisin, kexin, sedolisin [Serinicoccus hydrothermalis]|uniref:Peptidase S8 and S53, subtilisin, kexin, sedolisin n=1 Tax=Serinicoccus hydrothermalis TaxID=1758689 RepID=A0A1B1NAM0_9MICO|nr:S8/S53 family peptidase [Serinicoccus hydrothermalis]ANS78482.1 peptidase S8 and S53, subtilisin, kexin, sedolisin [Serinicoccus hydrothermalis]
MPHRDAVELTLPSALLRRHDARLLDPSTAARETTRDGAGLQAPSATAYRNSRLLVTGLLGLSAVDRIGELERVLREAGFDVSLRPDAADEAFTRWLLLAVETGAEDGAGKEFERVRSTPLGPEDTVTRVDPGLRVGALSARELDAGYASRVFVVPGSGTREPDPWALLLAARAAGLEDVDLEHLVLPGTGGLYWGGQTGGLYWGGQTGGLYWGGQGGVPGVTPDRTPVQLALPDPTRKARGRRAPVVVVPDTGLGKHPWFDHGDLAAERRSLLGWPVLPDGEPDPWPEGDGVYDELTGGLDLLSGHGTFIAGIVRQCAPDARIVALPVLDSAGLAAEHDVVRTLAVLLVLHTLGQARGRDDFGDAGGVVDVLSLSLGFYHQDGEVDQHPVRSLLELYGRSGVSVVAAAGNQATTTPMYPAGWALHAGSSPGRTKGVPLVGVGALNPDRCSVALFGNAGPWVTTHRPGVNVVSTLPVTFDASAQPARRVGTARGTRSTPDPDDLRGGFGVWSGTSFAAPWLAGELADALSVQLADDDEGDAPEALRGRALRCLPALLSEEDRC